MGPFALVEGGSAGVSFVVSTGTGGAGLGNSVGSIGGTAATGALFGILALLFMELRSRFERTLWMGLRPSPVATLRQTQTGLWTCPSATPSLLSS